LDIRLNPGPRTRLKTRLRLWHAAATEGRQWLESLRVPAHLTTDSPGGNSRLIGSEAAQVLQSASLIPDDEKPNPEQLGVCSSVKPYPFWTGLSFVVELQL
jgi:hypothetical protein